MADSKMVYEDVEEEGHGNLVLEMIKEVGKDENVTVSKSRHKSLRVGQVCQSQPKSARGSQNQPESARVSQSQSGSAGVRQSQAKFPEWPRAYQNSQSCNTQSESATVIQSLQQLARQPELARAGQNQQDFCFLTLES